MNQGKNVILIVMDTARFDFVNREKRGAPTTPNLDRIAESGTTFTNAFSAAPWTLPSHGSLFTGQYPSKHDAHAGSKHLDSGKRTLAEAFSSAGYDTVAASNNAWISESFGFGRGFDEFYRGWQFIQSETDLGKAGLMNEGTDLWKAVAKQAFDGNIGKNFLNALYAKLRFDKSDDDGARRTNEWVTDWLSSRTDDDPFFMFINYLEPHIEYSPPREFAEQFLPPDVSYEEARGISQNAWEYVTGQLSLTESDFETLRCLYAAEIAYTDARIGDLIARLESLDIWEDTLFLVVGDHGENIGDHGLMDHQYCLYDSLLHVPFIAHGGSFSDRGADDSLVQLTDIAPTLVEETNIDADALLDQAQGASVFGDRREYAIAEYVSPQPSRESIEKRVGDPHDRMDEFDRSLRAIRDDDHKLIRGSDGSRELYDVAEDPHETVDISDERPGIVDDLESRLDTWVNSFDVTSTGETNDVDQQTQQRLEDLGYI